MNITSHARDTSQYTHDHEILVQDVGEEDREEINKDEVKEKC